MTIDTEFDIGEEAFYMEDNKVVSKEVVSIGIHVGPGDYLTVGKTTISYVLLRGSPKKEGEVFKSKQELLESL